MSRSQPRPNGGLLGTHDYLLRTHRQFHWENAGYESFDAFLAGACLPQAQDHPARSAKMRWRPASASIGSPDRT